MAGTKQGGVNASITNKSKYGEDFYQKIGAKGGKKRNKNKGFGTHRDLARTFGAKGGAKSRRGKAISTPIVKAMEK